MPNIISSNLHKNFWKLGIQPGIERVRKFVADKLQTSPQTCREPVSDCITLRYCITKCWRSGLHYLMGCRLDLSLQPCSCSWNVTFWWTTKAVNAISTHRLRVIKVWDGIHVGFWHVRWVVAVQTSQKQISYLFLLISYQKLAFSKF